jgi:hypothetical protein
MLKFRATQYDRLLSYEFGFILFKNNTKAVIYK